MTQPPPTRDRREAWDPMKEAAMKTLGSLALLFVFTLTGSAHAAQEVNGPSCEKKSLSDRMQFATEHRASTILGKRDAWARQLSAFDLGIRQKTAETTSLKEFLDFTSEAALEWTPEERASWEPVVDRLSDVLEGLGVHLTNIDLVKTTGEEEFGASYTRQRAIIIPLPLVPLPAFDSRIAFFLLAHELFHVLSTNDSQLRDRTYALLGATRFSGIELPPELQERVLSNPDAYTYKHAVGVQTLTGPADVVPVNQVLVPLEEAIAIPNLFDLFDVVLVVVDVRTGQVVRDNDGNLITYSFLSDDTNWAGLMSRNTNYIIHPEEALADNFALLMQWRAEGVLPVTNVFGAPVNDVGLLESLEKVLANGCGR
jgi:hypothetical protein